MAEKRDRLVKIPYSAVRNGNRFFEPRGRMVAQGFRPMPLGPEGEAARRRAMVLYEKWLSVRHGRPAAEDLPKKEAVCAGKIYLSGSIGAAWQAWIKSPEWGRLAPSTRNKIWWEAWNKRIEPMFADLAPDTVTMDDLSIWRGKILAASGPDAAHKAMKVWRAFWGVMLAMRYTRLSDPSLKIRNTAPRPRHQRYAYGEAMIRAKTAWREGYKGLACIILVAWDTGFSPKDVRTLQKRHLREDPRTGRYVMDRTAEGRHKTGVAVLGTLSKFGDWLVRRYLAELGAELLDDAFLFRMRRGGPYGESRLGNDFATIRGIVDEADKRQLRDMRRSATMEVFAGGEERGPTLAAEKFGNSIDHSSFLFRTYNPVDLDKVRAADEARLKGRREKNKG